MSTTEEQSKLGQLALQMRAILDGIDRVNADLKGLKETKDAVECSNPGNRVLIKEAYVSPRELDDLRDELDNATCRFKVEYL